VAAVIIVAMISMTIMINHDPVVKNYKNQLPDDIKTTYDEIVAERGQIYFTGYLIGFALSVLFVLFNVYGLKKKMPLSAMVCLAIVISTLVSYFYYILSPKTKYMVSVLKTAEQRESWLKIYRSMQFYFHSSYALGAVAVGVFAYAFRGQC
jgi:hypothetical protein